MSDNPPWWQPRSIRIEATLGEAIEPLTGHAIGSHMKPFLQPEEVQQLHENLRSLQLRLNLSAFVAERLYELHLCEALRDSVQSPEEIRREVIKLGILHFMTLTEVADSEGWPDGTSPPEFYELARRDMEGQVHIDG